MADRVKSLFKCENTDPVNLDGTEDDMVYDASEDTKELDKSFIREIPVFQSDSKWNFEGFIVLKTPNLKRLC